EAGWPASNLRAVRTAVVGAPKIAAPVALAHSTRVASSDHSQAGNELAASCASRGSSSQKSRLPAKLIDNRPTGTGTGILQFNEFLVVRGLLNVHVDRRGRGWKRPITLIFQGAGQ